MIAKSQFIETSTKVLYNTEFMFKVFTTQTTAELFVVRVNKLMTF